ncbi:MAG: stage III sporulation protein AE [Brotaphodocola sp.]
MNGGKKWIIWAALLVLFGNLGPRVYAAEYRMCSFTAEFDKIPGQEHWESLDRFLEKEYANSGQKITFSGLMSKLMEGDAAGVGALLVQAVKKTLFQEVENGSHMAGQLLALGMIGALFSGFSDIFSGGEISEAGFFMTYLAAFSVMAVAFLESAAIAGEVLKKQIAFMNVLLPSYFLVVAWSGAGVTALAWHELILFLIAAIQWLYGSILLPLIRIYILISMTGNMTKEDMFSKMTEFLRGGIIWGTRSLIGIVLGFQLIQGMVLPYADAAKTTGVQKLLQAIPGVGQGAEAAAKMVLGSAVLIKNTMGAAAVLILILVSLLPAAKLAVLLILYRGTAALIQPVADKRLTACISSVADGQRMLLNLVCSGLCLFLITIALICAGTNVAYLV